MLNRTRKAFTLLELIVVVVVLGILAIIAVPTFRTVINKSAQSVAEQSAGTLARNANAIAGFDSGNTTGAHLTTAVGEYNAEAGGKLTVTQNGVADQYNIVVDSGGSTGLACLQLSGDPATETGVIAEITKVACV